MHVITGGAGFIGSALLWQLNRMGIEDIIVVDRLGTGKKWQNLVKRKFADFIHKDHFMEMWENGKSPFRLESLTHLGACSATTEKDADYLLDNNYHYSQKMCEIALKHGARFINASSAATYGAGEMGFEDDIHKLGRLRPINCYGYSKHLFDLWLAREKLLDRVASLKFFNVYGPNEYHKEGMTSVVYNLFHEIREAGKATLFASNNRVYENGEQKRDFVYVKDCAQLIAWLIFEGKEVVGLRNVGTGKARSFNDLAKAVFTALGQKPWIEYREMPQELKSQYQYYTCAPMNWLTEAGYPAECATLEEGVSDYVSNYLNSEDPYL